MRSLWHRSQGTCGRRGRRERLPARVHAVGRRAQDMKACRSTLRARRSPLCREAVPMSAAAEGGSSNESGRRIPMRLRRPARTHRRHRDLPPPIRSLPLRRAAAHAVRRQTPAPPSPAPAARAAPAAHTPPDSAYMRRRCAVCGAESAPDAPVRAAHSWWRGPRFASSPAQTRAAIWPTCGMNGVFTARGTDWARGCTDLDLGRGTNMLLEPSPDVPQRPAGQLLHIRRRQPICQRAAHAAQPRARRRAIRLHRSSRPEG